MFYVFFISVDSLIIVEYNAVKDFLIGTLFKSTRPVKEGPLRECLRRHFDDVTILSDLVIYRTDKLSEIYSTHSYLGRLLCSITCFRLTAHLCTH